VAHPVPRILAVDDSDDDIVLLRMAFRTIGEQTELMVAANGTEGTAALERAANEGRLPDLVTVDLNMPGMNGFEFLEQVRMDPRYASLCLIVFSSSQREGDIARAYASGATCYLMKPLDFHELLTVARAVVEAFRSGGWDRLQLLPCFRDRCLAP
jgi:CheY-like chemotaxis protein